MKELLSGIIGQVTNITDKVVLDKDEAARLAHEISTMAERHAQALAFAQIEAYQTNRRRICWAALGMMIACTAATIYDPTRVSEADRILMAQYLALSGLVGAYFAFGNKGGKS